MDAPRGTPGRQRILMTMYGWRDSGGGTMLPRLIATELARRGSQVTVFYAATSSIAGAGPYAVSEGEEDGVRLVGVHNRPHGLLDLGNPQREIDDPPIREAFARELAHSRPDVVHFHNLHNLGASLIDVAAAHGIPSFLTTHNHWLICPRNYMVDGQGQICAGPGDGSACAGCVGSADVGGHQRRLAEIRSRVIRGMNRVLAVSEPVRRSLLAVGYPQEMVEVVRQALPNEAALWEAVGAHRIPGRRGEQLVVAFVGSVYPHKGPQLLVEAAQRTVHPIRVRIHGEVPPQIAAGLQALDRRGVTELTGAFAPSELSALLAQADAAALPSTLWDCAPLAAQECRAARLALLAPRLGGLADAVRDEVDGLGFAGLDVEDLARQLDRLAGEPGLLERLQATIAPPASFAGHVDELERHYAGDPAVVGPTSRPPAVRWQGDHGLPTSLSIINGEVARRLPGPVQRISADGGAVDAPLPHLADVEVRHQWPPDLSPPRAGRLAVIAPWEFGAVPEGWVEPIATRVDELWVPSEYVRGMYLAAGIDPERVVVIPNGVDLDVFTPGGSEPTRSSPAELRLLFVGGLTWRKGPDVLLDAFTRAFADRDDVTLVIKDFGADTVYRNDRSSLREHIAGGRFPRIELIDETLSASELAALYRSCDVFVTPYRGEGFAMPVLEAMACGLPVIATGGGPTDEFLPEAAGWRIAARRRSLAEERIDNLATLGRPWVLEPDPAHLAELMRTAERVGAGERRLRGRLARAAAERLGWDAVARSYAQRIATLAGRAPRAFDLELAAVVPRTPPPSPPPPPPSPSPSPEDGRPATRLLATPAWQGSDRLGELLAGWAHAAGARDDGACLHLLADTLVDGSPESLEARVLAAAASAGVDLDRCGDVEILMEPATPARDARLHASMTAYVPLHRACAGHERLARAVGTPVVAVDDLVVGLAGDRVGV